MGNMVGRGQSSLPGRGVHACTRRERGDRAFLSIVTAIPVFPVNAPVVVPRSFDRDMTHNCVLCCTMPVPGSSRNSDKVALSNEIFFCFSCHNSLTRNNVQVLIMFMNMRKCPCSRVKKYCQYLWFFPGGTDKSLNIYLSITRAWIATS